MLRRFRTTAEEQIDRLSERFGNKKERSRQRKCQIKSRTLGKKQKA
jgi:hypothetical protein